MPRCCAPTSANGAYASFSDAPAFAEKVTADLQAVHKDGHLRLRVAPAEQRGQAQAPNGGPADANDVAKAGWLAPGVAYIDFTGFPGSEATLAEVRKFLAEHRDAKTLIIDARSNGGGGLAEMNLIFAEIFAQPTTLVAMDIRQAVEEKHGTPFDAERPADAESKRAGDHHPPRASRGSRRTARRAEGCKGLSPDFEEDLFRGGASLALAEAHASRDFGGRGHRWRRALRWNGADGQGLCRFHPGWAHLRSGHRAKLGGHGRSAPTSPCRPTRRWTRR